MSAQPKALQLADALDSAASVADMGRPPEKGSTTRQAAAELRRLAAVEQERDRLNARWVVVCQTALDVGRGDDVRTGGRPELGYALIADATTFGSEDEARAAILVAGLPLGWVLMPLSRLLPDLFTKPDAAAIAAAQAQGGAT